MNAPFDIFFARVDGFQATPPRDGINRAGRAICPSCGDKHKRKLDIAESASGVLLLNCRVGCSTHDIVQAVGMNAADLFPQNLDRLAPPERTRFVNWRSTISAAEAVEQASFMLSMSNSIDEFHLRQIALESALAQFKSAVRAALRGDSKRSAK